MDNKVVKFDSSQRQTLEVRQNIKSQKKKHIKSSKADTPNAFSKFFSKGWNLVRFVFFLAIIMFLLSVLLSTFSEIPEGKPFSWSLFFNKLREKLGKIGCNSPGLGMLFDKLTKVLTDGNFKFLFFLSSLFLTISLLVCFCP